MRLFMDVSIVVPACNSATTLDRCMQSLVNQTIPSERFEVIFVYDKSSDSSVEIVNKYIKYGNVKIVCSHESVGKGSLKNIGAERAEGEFIIFIDSDNFLRKDCLETMLDYVYQIPCIIFANSLYIDDIYETEVVNRTIKKYEYRKDIDAYVRVAELDPIKAFFQGIIGTSSYGILIHKKIAKEMKFDEDIYYDDILYVASLCTNKNIYFINDTLYYQYKNSSSINDNYTYKKGLCYVLKWLEVKKIYAGENNEYLNEWNLRFIEIFKLIYNRLWLNKNEFKLFIDSVTPVIYKNKVSLRVLDYNSIVRDNVSKENGLDLNMYRLFPDSVIFICDTDCHFRIFARIARELRKLDIQSIVIDISIYNIHKRFISDEERLQYRDINTIFAKYSDIKNLPLSGKAYVFALDWSSVFRKFIYDLQLYNVPAIGFYEGISDDFNVETKRAFLPYRLFDYLLIPGVYYKKIYSKKTYVVGMPTIDDLLRTDPSFPMEHLAIINCNFSYGVLDDKRLLFLNTAIEACKKAGISYVISQHPADRGDLKDKFVSSDSVYDLLKKGSFLISRFSTCIIESLALGKPVIYFNPHNEKMETFKDSLGAYHIASTIEDLQYCISKVINEIDKKIDFRKKAENFLYEHINYGSKLLSSSSSALAIRDIVVEDSENYKKRLNTILLSSKIHVHTMYDPR